MDMNDPRCEAVVAQHKAGLIDFDTMWSRIKAMKDAPRFNAEPTSFMSPKGEKVNMIAISGDGFKAKSFSPRILQAILDQCDVVQDAIDNLKDA
jgi:hypothetical protein